MSTCELLAATDGAGHTLQKHKCYEGVTYGCDATRTAMWVAPKCTGLFRCGVRRLACGAQLPGREIDAYDRSDLTVADKRQELVNCSCVHGATPAAGPWHAPGVATAAAALPPRLEDQLAARRGWASRPCPGHFAGAAACGIERDEWMMVDALVKPGDVVAEFGARFGTTSCRLARATNNSGLVVSFEPDTSVVPSLLRNRAANNCRFNVFNGVLSSADNFMRGGGSYGSRTGDVEFAGDPADKRLFAIPRLSLAQLEARLGARLSVALFDCEGCMPHVLSDELLARLRLVLIEEDAYKRVKPRAPGVTHGRPWPGRAWPWLLVPSHRQPRSTRSHAPPRSPPPYRAQASARRARARRLRNLAREAAARRLRARLVRARHLLELGGVGEEPVPLGVGAAHGGGRRRRRRRFALGEAVAALRRVQAARGAERQGAQVCGVTLGTREWESSIVTSLLCLSQLSRVSHNENLSPLSWEPADNPRSNVPPTARSAQRVRHSRSLDDLLRSVSVISVEQNGHGFRSSSSACVQPAHVMEWPHGWSVIAAGASMHTTHSALRSSSSRGSRSIGRVRCCCCCCCC